MCGDLFGGGSKDPKQIEAPARLVDSDVVQARDDQKRKQRAAAGSASTVRTSAAPTATGKTLLGA